MKKAAKIAGIVIAAIIVLLLIVPFFINADNFRPTVQAKTQEALGRNVQIGKLSFSLLSGSISADGITIADDPKFSNAPFVTAKALKASVQVMPLIFSRELHVDSITLEQPKAALISNAAGQWNYSSLGGSAKAPPATQASSGASNFAIDKIEISDGQVSISQIPTKQPAMVYSNVDLTVKNVSPTTAMPFTLSAKAPRGGTIKGDGTAGPIDMKDASLTPLQMNLKNDAVEIAGLAPTAGISGLLDMAAKFSSDGKQAHLEGNGQVKNLKAAADGVPAKQTLGFNYNTNLNYASRQGTLAANLTAGKDTAKLGGTYEMRDTTVLHMTLQASGVSIDEIEALLPAFGVALPSGASLRGGTLTANLSLQGPLDRLTVAGPMSLNNTKLAGFDLGSKMSSFGSLAGIKTGSDTTIQTFSSNVNVTPEVTRADAINLVVPSLGTMTGAGTIANKNLNFKMVAKVQSTGTGLLGAAGGGAGAKSIPFAIEGSTANPKFIPDMSGIVQGAIAGELTKGAAGAQVPSGVSGALGGLLGGGKKKK